MKDKLHPGDNGSHERQIRRDAEDHLAKSKPISGDLSEKTQDEIIHELRVHQIELELQNEELQKAYLELEHSRKRYIDLYDFSPVGYITLTEEALISEVNLTGATMLGVVRQRLIRSRFRKFVAQDDQGPWDRFYVQILHQQEPANCTIQLVRADGSEFFSRIEGLLVESCDRPLQVRLTISDISEQHEAVLKLGHNSQRIVSLLGLYQHTDLNDTAFMEYVLEESLKVVQSNIGFIGLISEDEQTMFGHAWSPEAMASCAVQTAPLHFPITKAGIWADSVRLKRPVVINNYEVSRPGGKFLPEGHLPLTRMISVPVMIGDRVVAVIAGANKKQPYDEEDTIALTTLAHTAWELLFHRRSEQAVAVNEQRLRKAQFIAKFGNVRYDYQSGTVRFSDEVYQICGIDRSAWTGSIEDLFAYIHPDDRELVREAFRVMRETGGKGDIEHRCIRPDGTIRWVHVITEATADEAGNQTAIEGIMQDITERKQSEQDRVEALAQITRNLEVLAILNDEIRNPLAIITAVCDMDPGQYTETILHAVKDIDRIIDQLDKGWLESEKVRSYLKRHFEI
ncbi:MAG TPA: GAF domain-containing protein [Methanospirillum sp.]|nr:GAF domain-containing protein [Methanospirillum sp.]